jgi:hypothetical protein
MGMDVVSKPVARRNTLLACAVVAFAVVASFLLGQIERPNGSTGKVLLLARVQPLPPLPSYLLPFAKISDIMKKNDAHLGEIAWEPLFKVAYDCKVERFLWEPLPVNHWPSFNEVLEIPLDSLTERQSRCISRIIIPPNVATAIAPKSDLDSAVRRMTGRDPFENWY